MRVAAIAFCLSVSILFTAPPLARGRDQGKGDGPKEDKPAAREERAEDKVVAAVIAGAVALVVAAGTSVAGFYLQERKLKAELRTEFMAEQLIVRLLSAGWNKRKFTTLQRHVGGFGDDERRQLLVRAGALRFYSAANEELWGLLSRNPVAEE